MNNVKLRNLLVFFTFFAVMVLSSVMVFISVNVTKKEILSRFNIVSNVIYNDYISCYKYNNNETVLYQYEDKYDIEVESCDDDFLKDFSFKIIDINDTEYIYSSSQNDRIFDQENNLISYYDISSDDIRYFCGELRKAKPSYHGTFNYTDKEIKYISNYDFIMGDNLLLLFSFPEKNKYKLFDRDYLFLTFIVLSFAGQIFLLIKIIKRRSEENDEHELIASYEADEKVISDKAGRSHKIPELPINNTAHADALKLKTGSLCVFCQKQKGIYDLMGNHVCPDCRDKLINILSQMK